MLSRSAVFELKPLEKEDIKILLRRAVEDEEKGLGSFGAKIEEEALEFLADMSGGDARSALNAIELGVLTTERSEDGIIHITLETASECIQKRVVNYDKKGDNHYDIISAFIKSMRGSDPDAAVFYLAGNTRQTAFISVNIISMITTTSAYIYAYYMMYRAIKTK